MFKRKTRRYALSSIVIAAVATGPGAARASQGVDKDGKQTSVQKENFSPAEALRRFTTDLNAQPPSRPFRGRSNEIATIITRLRSSDNSGVLVLAPPGAGKTVLKKELAARLKQLGWQAFDLDLNGVKAGSIYHGEYEDRLKAVLPNFEQPPGSPIKRVLLIDEAQRLPMSPVFLEEIKNGTGNGTMAVVLLTTPDEFRDKKLEEDSALVSRFLKVKWGNLAVFEVVDILMANREQLEKTHGVIIQHEAMEAIANAVVTYYPYEPAARKAMDIANMVMGLERYAQDFGHFGKGALNDELQRHELRRKSIQIDIDREPHNPNNVARSNEVKELDEKITVLKQKISDLDPEHRAKVLQSQLAVAYSNLKDAERNKNLELAQIISTDTIPEIKNEMEHLKIKEGSGSISPFDVGQYVSREIGIPSAHVTETIDEKLIRIRKTLDARVAGHEDAKNKIMEAIEIRLRNAIPIMGPQLVAVFDGLTGSGKSELARALAYAITGSETRIVRIEMNQMGAHTQSQLSGSSPGLVNQEKGGSLDALRLDPNMPVHLDEIDKTGASTLNMLHEAIDTGIYTDAMGRKIDLRHTMIIATSNYTGDYSLFAATLTNREIEQKYKLPNGYLKDLTGSARDTAVLDYHMLNKNMVPSMLGRFGLRLVLDPVTPQMAAHIVAVKLNKFTKFLYDQHKIKVTFDKDVAAAIVDQSFRPLEGARPSVLAAEKLIGALMVQAFKKFDAEKARPENKDKLLTMRGDEFVVRVSSLQVDKSGDLIKVGPSVTHGPHKPVPSDVDGHVEASASIAEFGHHTNAPADGRVHVLTLVRKESQQAWAILPISAERASFDARAAYDQMVGEAGKAKAEKANENKTEREQRKSWLYRGGRKAVGARK